MRFIRLFESDYSARTHFLTWNYRSTANIIACSNYLISHNQGRMKCEHPIVIDRARQMLPPGGEWSALEPSEGKVVIQHCTGAAQQAAEVVRQIQYIQRLQPECPLEKIAVIARNGLDKKELIWVRSALADAGIPCRFALEKDYGFPIRHCREIANYLLWLRERALESLTPAELCQQLPGRDQANRWHDIIYELIEQWELSQGGEPLPAAYFEHFILEYLHAQHSQVRFGLGVLLSTVHGVKGEEFEHVIILDGGWRSSHSLQPENNEEERRLFYVGMTRAISRLVIMHDDRAPNPYIEQLDPAVISHTAAQAVAPGILRRFSIIGLRQLYISFAGGHPAGHPIHSLLTDMQVGDSVQLVSVGNTIKVNANQSAIAQLSSAGKSQWQFSLSGIRKIEVLAMLQRSKTLTAEDYQVAVKVDNWYVPILLVETREEAAYDNIT
nr:3'-5' exonuclease [Klebsiella oxytoca]